MIAEVKKTGMIMLISQNENERHILQKFVQSKAVDPAGFVDCCGRKNCEFELKLKE